MHQYVHKHEDKYNIDEKYLEEVVTFAPVSPLDRPNNDDVSNYNEECHKIYTPYRSAKKA
jgi:hypothetical protein